MHNLSVALIFLWCYWCLLLFERIHDIYDHGHINSSKSASSLRLSLYTPFISPYSLPPSPQNPSGIDPNAEITRELSFSQMVFPPVDEDYDELVRSGYQAALSWDGTYKTKIGTRFANVQVLLMLWPIKFLEILITQLEDVFRFLMYLICGALSLTICGK